MSPNPKCGKRKSDHNQISPPKTYNLSADIAARILGHVEIDNNFSHNMYNFALVETSWRKPAIQLLYTHLKFPSYESMIYYLLNIHRYPSYASLARSICLSSLSGASNPEIYLCLLVQSCPNITSFKVSECPPTWVTDLVLLTMGAYWPRLTELSLHRRNRCHGNALLTAIRSWPDLAHLDLTNASGIKPNQYHEIIRRLPNLRLLRLSRLVNESRSPDLISDGILRAISDMSQPLKVIEFNNCTRLSNVSMLNCFNNLTNTLECLNITGCNQISGITLANIIAACESLRFVNVSRSSFNDAALRHLCGIHACQWIEQFAISNCSHISFAPFRLFADMLGSHVRDGHVKKCIVYTQGMARKFPKRYTKEIERSNPGLIIKASCEGFVLDAIIKSIVRPVV